MSSCCILWSPTKHKNVWASSRVQRIFALQAAIVTVGHWKYTVLVRNTRWAGMGEESPVTSLSDQSAVCHSCLLQTQHERNPRQVAMKTPAYNDVPGTRFTKWKSNEKKGAKQCYKGLKRLAKKSLALNFGAVVFIHHIPLKHIYALFLAATFDQLRLFFSLCSRTQLDGSGC